MQNAIEFVLANKAVLSAAGVALLDLVFALNNNWKSSGVFHWVYVTLGGKNY